MKFRKIFSLALALGLFVQAGVSSNALLVKRIAGNDRYETAVKANQTYFRNGESSTVVLAPGNSFRTSLYGSYLATTIETPFYLSSSRGLSSSTINDMKRVGARNVIIIGNSSELGKNIEDQITQNGMQFTRIQDTYGKSLDIAIGDYISQKFSSRWTSTVKKGSMIVNTNKFPDLLSVMPLAGRLSREQGVLLKDFKNYKSSETLRYIVGGENTIPSSFTVLEDEDPELAINFFSIDENNYYTTARFNGEDRYETAFLVGLGYNTEFSKANMKFDKVVIVDGTNFPDALASGLIANKENTIVLLTKPNSIPDYTLATLQEGFIINEVVIVGGNNSVSSNVENRINKILNVANYDNN